MVIKCKQCKRTYEIEKWHWYSPSSYLCPKCINADGSVLTTISTVIGVIALGSIFGKNDDSDSK